MTCPTSKNGVNYSSPRRLQRWPSASRPSGSGCTVPDRWGGESSRLREHSRSRRRDERTSFRWHKDKASGDIADRTEADPSRAPTARIRAPGVKPTHKPVDHSNRRIRCHVVLNRRRQKCCLSAILARNVAHGRRPHRCRCGRYYLTRLLLTRPVRPSFSISGNTRSRLG